MAICVLTGSYECIRSGVVSFPSFLIHGIVYLKEGGRLGSSLDRPSGLGGRWCEGGR